MNNHKRFEELLQGYLDNALNSKEKEMFKNHLKSCKRCEKKLKERKNFLETLRSTKVEIQYPDYLIDNILKNTTKKQSSEIISSKTIRWRYLAVGAAAILIVFSTILFNIEDSRHIFITKDTKGIRKEKILTEETKTPKSEKEILEQEESAVIAEKKRSTEEPLKLTEEPKSAIPETKADFTGVEKKEIDILSENLAIDKTQNEDIQKEAQLPSIAAKASAPSITSKSRSKEPATLGFDYETEKTSADIAPFTEDIPTGGALESDFEETRFVFPEEGSVVGKDFEIVIILKNPAENIEISLDGEKITNYTKTKDSNIIFIGSDSLPSLEEGLHFLSVSTTKEKNLTFYKEG